MQSITQSPQNGQYQFDNYGWPINPATGQSYTFDEIVSDETLPLPENKLAVRSITRARAKANGTLEEQPKKRKKSRSRSRSKANRRTFRASTVLARMRLSGAEKQVEKRAEAMAEQVERVNGRSILVNAGGEFYGVLEVA